MPKVYEISIPIIDFSQQINSVPIPVKIREASKDEIIDYLEQKNKKLEETLKLLEQYCGVDYIEACKELEEFINNNIVKEINNEND